MTLILQVGVHYPGAYKLILETDDPAFGGHGRLDHNTEFLTLGHDYAGRENCIMVYVPCRTAIVLARKQK